METWIHHVKVDPVPESSIILSVLGSSKMYNHQLSIEYAGWQNMDKPTRTQAQVGMAGMPIGMGAKGAGGHGMCRLTRIRGYFRHMRIEYSVRNNVRS